MLKRSASSRFDRRQLRRPLMRFRIQSNRRARWKTAHCGCLRPSALVRSSRLGSARARRRADLSAGSCPGASLPRHCPNGKGSTAATRNLQTVVDIRLNANRDRQAAGAGLPVTVRLTAGFDVTWLNQRAMLAT